ncbi:unnamed protein product [Rhizoctonia solani]|uniref:O-methylsterigmatocystin oxidoreductase n=1 Tax=Rhizoctonia solani TaxID=456999 RepID=A0A8H3CPP8_9AGAM|nr:unnamed protein product [Rhizoctonia solani]
MLEYEMTRFIQRLSETPEELFSHVRRATNATILKVTYGYNLKDGHDPILAKAEEAVNMFAYVTLPGIWLVDTFPFLKYLPWAPFKSKAREWQKLVHEFRDMPADFTIGQMTGGNHESSLMASWFEQAQEQPEGRTDEVQTLDIDYLIIQWAGASIYGGGSDTTVSAIQTFFLAMVYHPEVQKTAQAEIDRVVGNSRLPNLSDRESLRYTEAVYKEVLRWQPVAPFAIPHQLGPEDDVYQGMHIPGGCLLIPNIWAMSRDPTVYYDPETFNPQRFISTTSHEAESDVHDIIFGFGRR